MIFLSKLIYYSTFCFSGLFTIYLALSPVNNLLYHPFVRRSENIIMLIGTAIMITTLYFGRQSIYQGEKFFQGAIVLAGGCVLTFIVVMIGLFFFNGPIRWN